MPQEKSTHTRIATTITHGDAPARGGIGLRLVRVVVWLQFLRLVRMIVRAVFFPVLVFMLGGIAAVGMLVRMLMLMLMAVEVVVFVSVLNPIVGVLMGMSVSVFVLVVVAVIVFAFHRISLLGQANLSAAARWRQSPE